MTCGAVWPDEPAPDGRPVTCHLEQGHGGFWHRWWQQIHTGEATDGAIAWHTELAKTLTAGKLLTPTIVEQDHPSIPHVVLLHPMHAMLHDNLPDKP